MEQYDLEKDRVAFERDYDAGLLNRDKAFVVYRDGLPVCYAESLGHGISHGTYSFGEGRFSCIPMEKPKTTRIPTVWKIDEGENP